MGKVSVPLKKFNDVPRPEPDWEQRRYEIAKELMKGFASNSHNQCVDANSEMLAQWSVGCADALIEELKKTKK